MRVGMRRNAKGNCRDSQEDSDPGIPTHEVPRSFPILSLSCYRFLLQWHPELGGIIVQKLAGSKEVYSPFRTRAIIMNI